MPEYVCHICDLLNHHGCDRVSVTNMTETRGGKLHWATLTLIKEIGIKLGVLELSGMCQTINVCHICDLLNHHGCDRVSVTDMTEIRGGKLHWATCTHSKVIGMKPVVLKLFWMWKKSLNYLYLKYSKREGGPPLSHDLDMAPFLVI